MPSGKKKDIRLRTSAKAIVIEDGRLLTIRKRGEDGDYHVAPGGTQKPGEALHETLVREVREESRREHAELVGLRQKRQDLLYSARREKQRQEQLIQEYEHSEREVQDLLAELEERARLFGQVPELPPEGTGFAAARGDLPWPVQGKVIRWFGIQKESRFGTSTFNGGIDIRAPRGAEVLSVHRGRADYVNWLPGYGQCIILNHGGGYYTLYAHTSRVFVTPGDLVATGDAIATVGDTGSLLGEVLHFEIRKDAEPLNPAPWLEPVRLR